MLLTAKTPLRCLGMTLGLAFSAPLWAATITVDSLDDPGDGSCATDGCTLREAVAEAVDGDEIVFDASLGTGATDTIALSDGEIAITSSITITGNPMLEIDAQGASRIFNITNSPGTVTLVELLLRNGSANFAGAIYATVDLTLDRMRFHDNQSVFAGGAIEHEDGQLIVRRSRFEGNEVGGSTTNNGGGAIAASGGLSVQGSVFVANHARSGKWGGAIYFAGFPPAELVIERYIGSTVASSNFLGNSSQGPGGAVAVTRGANASFSFVGFIDNLASSPADIASGGALYLSDFLDGASMSSCRFQDNVADAGGAVHNQAALSASRTRMVGNEALGDGGAILNSDGGELTLRSGVLSGNRALRGAAVFNSPQSTLDLENLTISGNSGFPTGGSVAGAVYHNGGPSILTNVTIANNSAADGAQALHLESGDFEMRNTIITSPEPSQNCAMGQNVVSLGFNIDSGNTCGLGQPSDLVDTDPRLEVLQYNGGAAGDTHHPLADSPVIDGGTNVDCPARDQRLVERPFDGDSNGTATCDIGAVESTRFLFSDRFESP